MRNSATYRKSATRATSSRGRRPAWAPSIASLAFATVIGLTLLLERGDIVVGGSSPSTVVAAAAAPTATMDEPAPTTSSSAFNPTVSMLQGFVLGERNAGFEAALASALNGRSSEGVIQRVGQAPAVPTAALVTPLTQPSPTPTAVAIPLAESSEAITAASTRLLELSSCDYSHGPLYCVYEVQRGDTLTTIAKRAGLQPTSAVAAHDLLVMSNEPALTRSTDILEAGEQLRIPLLNGVIHVVLSQETLGEIATRYGVDIEDITAIEDNNIAEAQTLLAGQEILVPDPTRRGVTTTNPASTAGTHAMLAWPAGGGITSYFGPDHPKGIDIALMPGDSVTAAADGVVTFAGGDPCCSYGYFVIVDHGDGLTTVYGHLSRIDVVLGEKVSPYEQIGLGGSTGYGTGPHLHFEVHVGDSLVNPLLYLP